MQRKDWKVFSQVWRQKKKLIQNAKQPIVLLLIQLDLILKPTYFDGVDQV